MTSNQALLPGEDLVRQGLNDLAQARETDFSLLVLIAAPRLRGLGVPVPERGCAEPFEHQLYSRLEARLGAGAHSHYNSLIRRMVSLEREGQRTVARTS
ncbi:MAG: hypothetical protein IH623_23030 [Verrucomicrobia bacterium]|nr:hypothetical protein [Verrucomicrobiota bacterium]